jgi:hypothetical protein
MDWNTLAAAFVGGISGGGLGSAAALMRLRTDRRSALRARQWLYADVIADVWQLLIDINPERRGINLLIRLSRARSRRRSISGAIKWTESC